MNTFSIRQDHMENNNPDSNPPDQSTATIIPLPKEMEGAEEGQIFTATVVDQNGTLALRLEEEKPDEYTGTSPEDQELNSDDALRKYMNGKIPPTEED